jgi:hypothetical protein
MYLAIIIEATDQVIILRGNVSWFSLTSCVGLLLARLLAMFGKINQQSNAINWNEINIRIADGSYNKLISINRKVNVYLTKMKKITIIMRMRSGI